MTPERWQQIEAVYHAALACEAPVRSDYLSNVCAHDSELRREVESLLAHGEQAQNFLSAPAIEVGGRRIRPTLEPGSRIGAYEILSALGAGGMGEVYRAQDPHLGRQVAIKMLPQQWFGDATRRARFEREARLLASLNHPHIGAIFGLVEHDGVRGLVLELVEGETLAARLAAGPPPLGVTIAIASQVADALDTSHEKGIIHRDLKPANIIVRGEWLSSAGPWRRSAAGRQPPPARPPDVTIKVLDFGLGRAGDAAGSIEGGGRTVSSGGTHEGAVLGTPAYMSPEQARGKPVDKRTDIWAFGCVLFEMLAGCRPFQGDTASDTIAAILEHDPDWSLLPAGTPPHLRRLAQRCLEKEPKQRLRDIGDARSELAASSSDNYAHESATVPAPRSPAVSRRRSGVLVARIGGALVAVAAVLLTGRGGLDRFRGAVRGKSTPVLSTQRLSVELGVDGSLVLTDASTALSADGSLLAFVARGQSAVPMLHVRRLDQLTATPLNGTEGASSPCFSPDGQWVGFFADSKLKKVPVTGGAVVPLADVRDPRGMWWADDDSIVFTPGNRMALVRMSAAGGPAQPATTLANGEITHRFPQVLPGGVGVLYTASTEVNIGAGSTVMVQPLPSGTPKVIQRGAYFGRYVDSGHVVYLQDDTLFAVPFDLKRLEVTGPPAPMIDGIESDATRGSAQLTVSKVGTMVYIQGRNRFDARPIAWMDRTGTLTTLRAQPGEWRNPEFSPDGRRLAIDMRTRGQSDIWVYDWERDTLTPVTSQGTNEEFPVWTADGTRIIYRSFTSATDPSGYTIAWKRADGTGDAQVLLHDTVALWPGSWHPSANVLAYVASVPGHADDIMLLRVDGDEVHGWTPARPTAWVYSPARERAPAFSPDGKWLSYNSTESGVDQVYVRPFPGPGPRVMVSNAGGEISSWSRAHSELVFATVAFEYRRTLMVAPYRAETGSFRPDKPRPWAERDVALRALLGDRMYALHPDGVRVAVAPPSERERAARVHLTIVSNLFDHLRAIAPPSP